MHFSPATGLTFDDIILKPRRSRFSSRSTDLIDLSTNIIPDKLHIKYPIISANMDTVTGSKMAWIMRVLGGLGIIHRFMDVTEQRKLVCEDVAADTKVVCIGVGDKGFKRWEYLQDLPTTVLIDIAHGHSDQMIEQIRRIKEGWSVGIIAGNVATYEGAIDLISAGADAIKVGVGPGSLCTTRINTGCGVPQITAIMEVARACREVNKPIGIIADGGIRSGGDIAKALAAGAHAVMIGNLFAGTTEAPGELIQDPRSGQMYKAYRGMSSYEAQKDWKGYVKSVEGEVTHIPWKGSVERIFENLIQNLLSTMTYLNAANIGELQENTEAIIQTAAGVAEAIPHALYKR